MNGDSTMRARSSPGSRIAVAVVLSCLVVAATALAATADIVTNTLDTSPDRQLEQMSLRVGDPDGATAIVVIPQAGDGDPQCNIDPGETLTLDVTSDSSSVATVSPAQVSFHACNVAAPITVHAVAGGTAGISVTVSFNNTGNGIYQNAAAFAALVSPASPGPPSLASGLNPNNNGDFTLSWAPSSLGNGPYSWGFIGCSNTHDTLWGYHDESLKHMFWPASFPNDGDPHNIGGYGYTLEGQTLLKWSDPSNPAFNANWSKFDRMTDVYNPGSDPPLVWVQLCENINPGDGNYHVSTYSEVQSLLSVLSVHAPTSVVYISPMHTYEVKEDGKLICDNFNGVPPDPINGLDALTTLANQAVQEGLALAGPGSDGIPALGPIGTNPPYVASDNCHPNGNPNHGTGGGSDFLGSQLAAFFDPLGEGESDEGLNYTLFHQDADDSAPTVVATDLTTNTYTFTDPAPEPEGTWTYFAQASVTTQQNIVLTSNMSVASAPMVVDRTSPLAPTLSVPAPDFAGNGGWYKDTVTVGSADNGDPDLADGSPGSGVDPASVVPVTFNTSGSHTATGAVLDLATNESAPASLAVQVDADAPSVSITCPSSVLLNGSGSASWTASDGESGLASTSAGSITVNSAAIGSFSVTSPVAQDNVGHTKSATCSYSVIWNFSGFFSPVDNPETLNVAKAGSAIPVKFSLAGDRGLSIMASNSPTSSKISCDLGEDLDNIEETVNAGNSSLSYDPVAGQYVYVWKTDKTWSGTCRQLTVTLVDGTTHIAFFNFTK